MSIFLHSIVFEPLIQKLLINIKNYINNNITEPAFCQY